MKFLAVAGLLAAGVANGFPLLKGLESKLAPLYPQESAAGLRDILERSLALAASNEGLSPSYITCSRDFSGCPEGFSGNGGTCTPGIAYDGSCGALDMGGLTPTEKHQLADSCGAVFPCMDSCAKDYSQ